MEVVILVIVVAVLVAAVSAPFRSARGQASSGRLRDLEAAREAKLREIRDAELDHRTGKLSDADYAAIDAALRAEAVEILHALDAARAAAAPDAETVAH